MRFLLLFVFRLALFGFARFRRSACVGIFLSCFNFAMRQCSPRRANNRPVRYCTEAEDRKRKSKANAEAPCKCSKKICSYSELHVQSAIGCLDVLLCPRLRRREGSAHGQLGSGLADPNRTRDGLPNRQSVNPDRVFYLRGPGFAPLPGMPFLIPEDGGPGASDVPWESWRTRTLACWVLSQVHSDQAPQRCDLDFDLCLCIMSSCVHGSLAPGSD